MKSIHFMTALRFFDREIIALAAEDSFVVLDRTNKEFDYPIHYHPEFEINFILNGKGVKRVVGDSIEEIDDFELVLLGPNLYHAWELNHCKNTKIHEILIQFQYDLFGDFLLSKRLMTPIQEMFNRSIHGILFSKQAAESLTPRLMKISKLQGLDCFLEITSLLYDLANSSDQRLLSTFTAESINFEKFDKMKVIYDYIQNNFSQKITLEEVASLVNMTTISFNRFMKKRTDKTFVEYINSVRIGYASRLLAEKDLSIAEIAFKTGYHNIGNFNRVFKKLKNCTPSQFRDDFGGVRRIM